MRLNLCLFSVLIFFSLSEISVKCASRMYTRCVTCTVPVLHMEEELILSLGDYKIKLKEKLATLRFYADKLRRENKKSENDPEKYLSNPLKAFALVRRLHSDWFKWQKYMAQLVGKAPEDIQLKMKTELDLRVVSAGIILIQKTYNMSVKMMASGIINGKQYDARLSALDCHSIGKYIENKKNYKTALMWYNVSLDMYTQQDDEMSQIFDFDKAEIWNSTAYVHHIMGNHKAAAYGLSKAIVSRPNSNEVLNVGKLNELYARHDPLCRGEIPQKSKLFCRYNSTTSAFLKLAALKMEEVSIDPYIVLYHDIVYDNEIEELKRLSMPQFNRSLVGIGVVDPTRSAQSARLFPNSSAVVQRINQRIVDISGFLTLNPPLQIVSYGLGGHYSQHLDFEMELPEDWKPFGNRIGTVLIYLSDVKEGGGTAFTAVNKVIQPRKGTAVLWHHLDNSGNGILDTMHSSCPVLVGSKWILIQFIYYLPQIFRKPCYKNQSPRNRRRSLTK